MTSWPLESWRDIRAAQVTGDIAGVPVLAEQAGRLSALPMLVIENIATADPAGTAELAASLAESAEYLTNLAAVFSATAARLKIEKP